MKATVIKLHGAELDVKQASDYLLNKHGIKQSPKTIYNKCSDGQGPRRIIRFGKPYFLTEDLDAWVERNTEVKKAFSR